MFFFTDHYVSWSSGPLLRLVFPSRNHHKVAHDGPGEGVHASTGGRKHVDRQTEDRKTTENVNC